MISVAIQGIKGSFHEQAAQTFFGSDITLFHCSSFEEVCKKTAAADTNFSVLAIENTIAGKIQSNLDLIQHFGLKIVDEIKLRICLNLASMPGTSLDEIEEVYSHEIAFIQVCDFLEKHKNLKTFKTKDTASAMLKVSSENSSKYAAIGSKHAADTYGLEIIAKDIQTTEINLTKFAILSK